MDLHLVCEHVRLDIDRNRSPTRSRMQNKTRATLAPRPHRCTSYDTLSSWSRRESSVPRHVRRDATADWMLGFHQKSWDAEILISLSGAAPGGGAGPRRAGGPGGQ